MFENLTDILFCLNCHGNLKYLDNFIQCGRCSKKYSIIEGTPIFEEELIEEEKKDISDSLIHGLKKFFKRYNKLYFFMVPVLGALFVGQKKGKDILNFLPQDAVIINLGSGPKLLDKHIINIDCFKFDHVSMVANAARLPFKDGTVDAVICESVLEHIKQPLEVIKESERILKKGGWIYISVPFMDAYHSSPDDYYRWTASGLREMLVNFDEKELKIAWGPTSTLNSALANWLGIAFSFGNKTIYQVWTLLFMLVLSPLKLLDFIFRYYKFSNNASVGFYFMGKKK